MRKIHVDYNRKDVEGRIIKSLPADSEPLTIGEEVELWQAGEPDMVFTGTVTEITDSGRYKITVNWV